MKSSLARRVEETELVPMQVLQAAGTPRPRAPGRLRHAAAVVSTHWTCALLVAVAAATALARELTENSHLRNLLIDAHRQLGLLVLLGLGVRLALRIRIGLAETGADMAWPLRVAAHAAHLLLYGLLLAIPLLGWALTNAHGLKLNLFGVLPLPALVGDDADVADALTDRHVLASWVLLAAVSAHVAAALWHHFVRRDQILTAMLPALPGRPRTHPELQFGGFRARWSGRPRRAR
jgi:cytochrome b561